MYINNVDIVNSMLVGYLIFNFIYLEDKVLIIREIAKVLPPTPTWEHDFPI